MATYRVAVWDLDGRLLSDNTADLDLALDPLVLSRHAVFLHGGGVVGRVEVTVGDQVQVMTLTT